MPLSKSALCFVVAMGTVVGETTGDVVVMPTDEVCVGVDDASTLMEEDVVVSSKVIISCITPLLPCLVCCKNELGPKLSPSP